MTTMTYDNTEYGFARPDVSRLARRQLGMSAVLIALVGFATLGAAYSVKTRDASAPQAAAFGRLVPDHAAQKLDRTVSTVRPG
jgi:hypothetical protein